MRERKEWEVPKEPYGKNIPIFKNYESVAKHNLRPNFVDFKLYCDV